MADQSTTTLDAPTTGESTHPLAETGKQAGERASHLIERGADIGLDQAVDGIEIVADSIRRVSSDMETEKPQIAELASGAADQAEALANYLRETDVRQLVGNVEDFARRQPLLFVGGAFLLGVAASRFIKAASGSSAQQGYGQQPRRQSGNGTGTSHRMMGSADYSAPTGAGY